MKLLLLIILLCGITSTPGYTVKPDKKPVSHVHTDSGSDLLPAGLLFQF